MSIDPGFSDSVAAMVFVEIDGDLSDNQEGTIRSNPDACEFITSFRIPLHEFDFRMRCFEDAGCVICLSVWCYRLGIQSQQNKTEYCKKISSFNTTKMCFFVVLWTSLFVSYLIRSQKIA